MLLASRSCTIKRPVEVVRAQFADVGHHQRSAVHDNVTFTMLEESEAHCDYDQVTRQGPVRIRQRFHLDRSDPSRLVNTVISGAFRGGDLTFTIDAEGPSTAVVTATLSGTPRPSLRLARPLLGRVLGRSLDKALTEDRHDLESGNYDPPDLSAAD